MQTFFGSYQLVDISKIPIEEFNQLIWYGTLAQAMKAIHENKDINQLLKCVISRLCVIAKHNNLSYISTIITYFSEVGEMHNQKEFDNIMKRNFTKKEQRKIMTYAEQLRFEGMIEGMTKGRTKGRTEGRNEGRTEATMNVAMRLLQQDLDPKTVAKGTALPLAKVLNLKKKIAACKK